MSIPRPLKEEESCNRNNSTLNNCERLFEFQKRITLAIWDAKISLIIVLKTSVQVVLLSGTRNTEHGNMRERRERVVHASLRPTETFMVRVVDPRKQHVSVYKNVQTIIS